MPVFRKAAPVVKSFIKSKPVQQGMKKIKKRVIKSAANSANDIIAGRNPKNRLKKDLVKIAKITSDTVLDNSSKTKIKNKKRPKNRRNSSLYFGRGAKKKSNKKISVYDM